MRNTKKWLVLLLCVMMLVNTLGITAMATGNESPIGLYVSPAAGSGSSLKVQILASEAQTVADGKLVLTYDAEKLTFIDAVADDAWSDAEQVTLSVNDQAGKVILAFANADTAGTGVLFTLTFTVKASGDSVIAIDGESYITGVDADLSMLIGTCPSANFVDLGALTPASHEAVDYMVANGYLYGMTKTQFGPYVPLSRCMMVTVLYRIAGCPQVDGTLAFSDVAASDYYADAVIWAAENGITYGVTEKLFAPHKSLNRQELVTFLYRFAEYMNYDRTATTDLSTFDDAASIAPFAVKAFQWAVAEGVVYGTTETTLEPLTATTREQVVVMVYRLLSQQD